MLPVTDSTLDADALCPHVLAQYPVGPASGCRLHTRGLNDTYMVETKGGALFLRVYRFGGHTVEAIRSELAVLQHLAAEGVTVSTPIARTDGGTLTSLDCPEGERWAVLFTAAPGREISQDAYTEELAVRYGAGVASIHGAADTFPEQLNRPPLDLASLLDDPLSRIVQALSHRRDAKTYIQGLGSRLKHSVESMSDLSMGLCHGDLHGQNTCEMDGTFTFFDFDCCGWGYRSYDLAVFPWVFALGGKEPARIEAMGRAYLTGYSAEAAVAPADVAAIPAFVAIRQIWLVGMHIRLGDRFGWGWMGDGYFDRHLNILRDWEKNFLDRPASEWLSPSDV